MNIWHRIITKVNFRCKDAYSSRQADGVSSVLLQELVNFARPRIEPVVACVTPVPSLRNMSYVIAGASILSYVEHQGCSPSMRLVFHKATPFHVPPYNEGSRKDVDSWSKHASDVMYLGDTFKQFVSCRRYWCCWFDCNHEYINTLLQSVPYLSLVSSFPGRLHAGIALSMVPNIEVQRSLLQERICCFCRTCCCSYELLVIFSSVNVHLWWFSCLCLQIYSFRAANWWRWFKQSLISAILVCTATVGI